MQVQQSPAFLSWFGESQVVDAAARPRIVYHGTAVSATTFDAPPGALPRGAFTVFDREYLGAVTESSDSRAGFWFTADKDRAWAAAQEAKACGHGDSAYVYAVFLRIRRPLVTREIRALSPAQVAKLAKAAHGKGHDGLIFTRGEGVGSDFLVFEPTQIKSAVANIGLFDSDNPCICA